VGESSTKIKNPCIDAVCFRVASGSFGAAARSSVIGAIEPSRVASLSAYRCPHADLPQDKE
jgi:hypothetical protein